MYSTINQCRFLRLFKNVHIHNVVLSKLISTNRTVKNVCQLSNEHSCIGQSVKRLMSSYRSGNCRRNSATSDFVTNVDEFDDQNVYDEEYDNLVKRTFRTSEMGHQVFVIQPFIKWGPSKKHLTKPDYQLNEAVALIETLNGWSVVDKIKISLTSFNKGKLFGKGNLETLKEKIQKDKMISAVFISVNLLSRMQQEVLEEEFGVPVYDRYNVVVQIFRRHAVTTEAKLQVAMSEIPFMWYRIKTKDDKGGRGSSGETLLELRKRLLTDKEKKIQKQLEKLRIHRTLLRKKRQKKEYPVVAVVGYTNAGKTSLIKALTDEITLAPKNQLFATLDVTVHEGILPRNVKVLYVDTIGFISDIPTELIAPFNVTLEDAVQSDLVIHVMDISNPDILAQSKHVIDTLQRLQLDNKLITNIINVANKCDLVSESNCENLFAKCNNIESYNEWINNNNIIKVSCLNSTGLDILRNKIVDVLLKLTGRIHIRIRVKCGGPEFNWLQKESSIVEIICDDKDNQFTYLDVIITENNLMKFKHKFIHSKQYRNC